MALSVEDVRHLLRIQGAAGELQGAVRAWKGGNTQPLSEAAAHIEALVTGVHTVLSGSDPPLAEQFAREIALVETGLWGADARSSALFGWLKGATAAWEVEAQMTANARAYAEARIRVERGVGFKASAEASSYGESSSGDD